MSDTHLAQGLRGKPVISVTNGNIVASFEDVLIDPETQQVTALVTAKDSLSNRAIKVIPSKVVQFWGRDTILINRTDVLAQEDQLPGIEKWLSVSRHLKGRTVVNIEGTRIGQLYDVVIDTQGQIVGYDLMQVFVEGPLAHSMQVPVEAMCSLSPDALIVDVTKIAE